MKKSTQALLFNFICFGLLFLFFRYVVGGLIPLPYLPLVLGSAVLASFVAPKFLVKQENDREVLYIKFPFLKSAKKL